MSDNNLSTIIKSQLYGEIILEQEQVYHFDEGIVGFSELKQFALLPYEDTDLFILQSFSEELSLLLLPAIMSANNEGFHIDEATVQRLGVEEEAQLAVFYVLRFIDQKPYINLKAPILIVPDTQKGCQYVLSDDRFSVRTPLVLAGDDSC